MSEELYNSIGKFNFINRGGLQYFSVGEERVNNSIKNPPLKFLR